MELEYSKETKTNSMDDNELLNALKPQRNYTKEMIAAGATPLLVGFLAGGIGDAAGIAAQGIDQVRKEELADQAATRKSLADALKERMKVKASGAGKLQQTTLDMGGQPAAGAFDPSTGKYFDSQGREILNPVRGFKPDIRVDPKTKELARITSAGDLKPLENTKGLNLREKEVATKTRDKLLQDPSYKSYKSSYESAEDIIAMVSSENPIAQAGAIVATAKGLFREVGNLSEGEQRAITGNPSFAAAFERQYGKIFEGEKMTPEDMNDFIEMANIIKKSSGERVGQIIDNYAKSEGAKGEDVAKIKATLDPLRPTTYSPEKAIKSGKKVAPYTIGYTKEVKGKLYRYRGNNQWEEIKK